MDPDEIILSMGDVESVVEMITQRLMDDPDSFTIRPITEYNTSILQKSNGKEIFVQAQNFYTKWIRIHLGKKHSFTRLDTQIPFSNHNLRIKIGKLVKLIQTVEGLRKAKAKIQEVESMKMMGHESFMQAFPEVIEQLLQDEVSSGKESSNKAHISKISSRSQKGP